MIELTPPPIVFPSPPSSTHILTLSVYLFTSAEQRGTREVMNETESHTGQDQQLDCDACMCVICVVLLRTWDKCNKIQVFQIMTFLQSDVTLVSPHSPEASAWLMNWSLMMRLEEALTIRSQKLKPVWKCINIQFLKRLQETFECIDVSGRDPNFSLKTPSPKQLVVFQVYLLCNKTSTEEIYWHSCC